ncbi:MAG: HAD family hydrolase [Chloroflexota bacterium]|nr:HAD family hydrolase [Chloroflexota bacterium]
MNGRVTVSFDLDGVIMQNPFLRGVTPHILQHLRCGQALRGLPPEEADRLASSAIREAWMRHAAQGNLVACYNWDAIYREVSEHFGVEPPVDVATLVAHYCGVADTIWLLPGARSGLERLRVGGLAAVAITNGYHPYQWPVLEALGVAHLFDAIYTPDIVGYAKPDPLIFESVPGLRAHVGDNLIHDIVGANLAGKRSVWLRHDLPEAISRVPWHERAGSPACVEYVSERLAASQYLPFHPEATPETAAPNVVVSNVDEAVSVLLEWYG